VSENAGAAPPFLVRALRVAAAGCAAAAILLYVGVALARIGYPYELEWMEGASVDQVGRVLAGQALYTAPSLDFVPLNYPPLYFLVSAGVARLVGLGFLALRLVSFLASLGCMGLLFVMARRETGTAYGGLLAAGLFAATFRASGAWLDLARVDSLFLFLLLASMALARRGGIGAQVLAGIGLALSFFTKQGAIAAIPVMLLWLAPGRQRLAFTVVAVAAIIGGSWLLGRAYGDWYSYYLLDLPARHAWSRHMALGFLARDLARPLPIACLMALVPAWSAWRRRSSEGPGDPLFLYALAAGCVGISWLARTQPGGWDNVLLPAYASLALLFAAGAESLARGSESAALLGDRRVWAAAACIAQLALLAYDPRAQVPRARDRAAGDSLVAALAAVPGDVFVPYHGYLGPLAGKRPHAHIWGLDDVIERDPVRGPALRDQVSAALRERRFAAVVVESDMIETRSWLLDAVERSYAPGAPAFAQRGAFWPVTGMRTRPERIDRAPPEPR
jgi:hypothetical protein